MHFSTICTPFKIFRRFSENGIFIVHTSLNSCCDCLCDCFGTSDRLGSNGTRVILVDAKKSLESEVQLRHRFTNRGVPVYASLWTVLIPGIKMSLTQNCIFSEEDVIFNDSLGDFLCIPTPNTGQLNPLFHTFAEFRLIVNGIMAWQSTDWLAANAQFSPNVSYDNK